ncbi:deacetoxyvindoline 4-hydroxylase-like isoform X2 [Pistacia vera]|uniref:deacetoxyvindoline 4-hydroxylase-like isoform X2 n=1 Tax=Pistacia vera TaxID=55513 RepID=UPI0012639BA0|nr:deacetoxyvindoline 4-hydroxylase-like isoform X2 [Pistacia vera]
MEVISHAEKTVVNDGLEYDHVKEMDDFNETKAGVKGLVDSGVVKLPRIFIHPPDNVPKSSSNAHVPVIDLKRFESSDRRPEIVKAMHGAAKTWGFFQRINHGVPDEIMDKLLACLHEFHEQPYEVKFKYYSHDRSQPVRFYSNEYINKSKPGNWRDTLKCLYFDEQLDTEALPIVCREPIADQQ